MSQMRNGKSVWKKAASVLLWVGLVAPALGSLPANAGEKGKFRGSQCW